MTRQEFIYYAAGRYALSQEGLKAFDRSKMLLYVEAATMAFDFLQTKNKTTDAKFILSEEENGEEKNDLRAN